jgi:hypothetical protein
MTAHNDSWKPEEAQYIGGTSCGPSYTSFVGPSIDGPYLDAKEQSGDTIVLVSNNSTFSTYVSLYEFNCPSVSIYLSNSSWGSLLSSTTINATSPELLIQSQSGFGFFIGTNISIDSKSTNPQELWFGSFFNRQVTLWECYSFLNTRNVTYTCTDTDTGSTFLCSISQMGISSISTETSLNTTSTELILAQWPRIDSGSPGRSSIAERFLFYGPDLPRSTPDGNLLMPNGSQTELVDLSTLDNLTFSQRLTTLFNSYYLLERDATDYGLINSTSSTPLSTLPFTLIVCNWIYFTLVLIVSMFLLLCVGFSAWLNHNLSTPDILGYVSSLTIENPHFSVPGNPGTFLDGMERAKALGKMKVQVRDVQQGEMVGKFAFTNVVVPVQDTRRNNYRNFV